MASNPVMAAAYRRGLSKIHPLVGWTTHFVDRLIEKSIPEQVILPALANTLRNHLLEIIFDSVRQDFSTRIQISDHVVVAKFNPNRNTLDIITVYVGDTGRQYKTS